MKYFTIPSLMLDIITLANNCQLTIFHLEYLLVTNNGYYGLFVFLQEGKKIIQNKIWQDHSIKNQDYSSIWYSLKHFTDTGTMDKKEGSSQPMPAGQPLQKKQTNKKSTEQMGISRSSIRRMLKRSNFAIFKIRDWR